MVLHFGTFGLIEALNPELGWCFCVELLKTLQTNKQNQTRTERVKGELRDLFPDSVFVQGISSH